MHEGRKDKDVDLVLKYALYSHTRAQLKACVRGIQIGKNDSVLCQINAERSDYRFE